MSICTQLPTQSNICRINNSQQCWSCCVHLHTTANTIQHLQNQQLLTMLELLCPFAHNCQHNPTSAESTTPNNVGVVVSICTQLPTQSNICRTNNSQQCWSCCVHLHTTANTIQHLQNHQLPTMLELLCPFAHNCQHNPTSAESTTPNNVGSYCVHLHTTANTIQHLQNQQLPTMLGVIVSICTRLPTPSNICKVKIPNNVGSCCVRLHGV